MNFPILIITKILKSIFKNEMTIKLPEIRNTLAIKCLFLANCAKILRMKISNGFKTLLQCYLKIKFSTKKRLANNWQNKIFLINARLTLRIIISILTFIYEPLSFKKVKKRPSLLKTSRSR